jgi:hypothetical protein
VYILTASQEKARTAAGILNHGFSGARTHANAGASAVAIDTHHMHPAQYRRRLPVGDIRNHQLRMLRTISSSVTRRAARTVASAYTANVKSSPTPQEYAINYGGDIGRAARYDVHMTDTHDDSWFGLAGDCSEGRDPKYCCKWDAFLNIEQEGSKHHGYWLAEMLEAMVDHRVILVARALGLDPHALDDNIQGRGWEYHDSGIERAIVQGAYALLHPEDDDLQTPIIVEGDRCQSTRWSLPAAGRPVSEPVRCDLFRGHREPHRATVDWGEDLSLVLHHFQVNSRGNCLKCGGSRRDAVHHQEAHR